jgi:hypothetical protein
VKALDRGRWLNPSFRGSAWALFAGVAILLILPALLLPNPFGTDGPVHVRWQAAYAQALGHGHLFPRWLPGMNGHFGSPAFFFYPPLLQWLAALFAPVAPGDAGAIRRLALALGVLSLIGAQGCRCWLRALGASEAAAMMAGALWLVMPYRAFVDVYQRCALAEVASLCVLPWLGCCAVWLAQGRKGAWSAHAMAIAVLAYAHMPGMVIGYLLAAGHGLALVLAETGARRRAGLLLSLGTSALAGLAVSAAMLVPALSLLGQIVDPTAMSGERNQPHNWLLFSGTPWIDPVARLATIGVIAMTVVLTAGLARLATTAASPGARGVGWAMIATVLVVGVLNLGISRGFWDLQTPLSRIQFPFRLLGASSLAVCVLAGLAYDRGRAMGQAWRERLLWLLMAGLLMGDMAAFAYQRLRPRDTYPPTLAAILASNEDTSEYVLGDVPTLARLFAGRLAFAPNALAVRITGGDVGNRRLSLAYQAPHDQAPEGTAIALHQFAFTGWQCRVDNGPWLPAGQLQSGLSSRGGRVPLCAVPSGTHRLEARLPASPAEQAGLWLTLVGLATVILMLGLDIGRSRRMPDMTGSGPA